jgi:DNA-binding response OmpR family regulator
MESKKRILIVDDEPINLEFFDVMLTKLGFIVGKAENGEEALDEVKRFKPDLIILDNIMPKLSGWEVTKILKTREDFKEFLEVPIIMFSAMDDVKDKVEGFELGIDDYITKPYNFSEVLARIRALLRARELVHQLENRESRIALTEKLNAGLIDFTEKLRAPVQDLQKKASGITGLSADGVAFMEEFNKQSSAMLGRLKELENTIAELKTEENHLKQMGIEIQSLRTSQY